MKSANKRELLLQLLYSYMFNKDISEETFGLAHKNLEEDSLDINTKEYNKISKKVLFINDCIDILDDYIQKYSKTYTLDRFSKIDLCIMRIAIYEMIKEEKLSNNIAIAEAMRLLDKYSDQSSKKYINGILGSIDKDLGNNKE